ncbi:hypothetical protein O6H91_12G036500 [Diphasiastrum complanatum]|uniref:Uncharacterized protein n=1 Tax=Diphasiastrum complanatum TaxID=34168 RepID=A0ACC2C0X3_DIPCM|nr:hypothetical protein O6H91_Y255100 [Diphasiastrum complanatum]KAJ7535508.1 hypothetical protein O6H91_12G036500 [Diphasiastrum complanatum]
MAGGGKVMSFVARTMQYVVNELLVDRLSNNVTFQKFAVRSAKTIEDITQKGFQTKEELAVKLKTFSEEFSEELTQRFKDPKRQR